MGFKNKPMTVEEIESRGKFYKEGPVDFAVVRIEETTSKSSGLPMIVVNLQLWDAEGKTGTIKDYITESMNWRLRDFLEAVGYVEDADLVDLDFDKYQGCEGKGRIKYKKDDEGKLKHVFNYVMPSFETPKPALNDPLEDIKF